MYLLDRVLVLLAVIKSLVVSPFMYGTSDANVMRALWTVERPFLTFAFWLAEVLLPFSRVARRAGVRTRDGAMPSRDVGRTIPVRVHEVPGAAADAPVVMWMHGAQRAHGDGGRERGRSRGPPVRPLSPMEPARLPALLIGAAVRQLHRRRPRPAVGLGAA